MFAIASAVVGAAAGASIGIYMHEPVGWPFVVGTEPTAQRTNEKLLRTNLQLGGFLGAFVGCGLALMVMNARRVRPGAVAGSSAEKSVIK